MPWRVGPRVVAAAGAKAGHNRDTTRGMNMADFVSGYNIVRKLGDGARSQVFRVVRPETGEVFALKRVIRESHEDTRFLDQAINEHETSRLFSHAYLRKSIDLKRLRRLFKLVEVQVVMVFVDGTSLDKCRPERIDKTAELFLKVAEGLDYMHERGFLHTDIKPSNILMTYDGGVKIIDFGQSCEIGFKKPRIQGTPDYIAPEQVERRSLRQSTDVFNLGATLYWALTGKTYPTVIQKNRRRQETRGLSSIPTPQEVNSKIPIGLSQLVMECCRYDRSLRPNDMKEIINRLKTAQHVLTKRRDAGHDLSIRQTPRPRDKPAKSDRHATRSARSAGDDANSDDSYDDSAFSDGSPDTDPGQGPIHGGSS